jgi:hypothetical protein
VKPIYLITTNFLDISMIFTFVYTNLNVQKYDNVLYGQGYRTTQDAVIDEYGAMVKMVSSREKRAAVTFLSPRVSHETTWG